LLIDEDQLFAELFATRLRRAGLSVFTAPGAVQAVALLEGQNRIGIVIGPRVVLLEAIHRTAPDVRTILMADHVDGALVLEATGHRVLSKDMSKEFLIEVIRGEVRRHGRA
jgi:DNA-binding NtrC family response regulator